MKRTQIRYRKKLSIPDISLTPLIDTALTLLIIFMVTAPAIKHSVALDLPKGSAKDIGLEMVEIVVSIDAQGMVYVNEQPVALADLGATIKMYGASADEARDMSVCLRVNGPTTTCDTLVAVIEKIKEIPDVKTVKIATKPGSLLS